MYWGLMYGLVGGFLLFVVFLLSQYLTIIWFPVFLAGVIWGGYRNYQKQRKACSSETGQSAQQQPVVQEFKEAASDIVSATRDMLAEQQDDQSDERSDDRAA